MKHLKAVLYVVVCLAAYYSYAKADGGRDGGRDSGGHHSGDTTSNDSSHSGRDDADRDSSDHSGRDGGSHDSTDNSGHDSTEVRHDGDDSTEVRHGGDDSTEVRHSGDDSTEVRHGGDDSTEVEHDSTEVHHGGDDSTHVEDHGGRGEDSTHVDDHHGRRADSVRVDDRGPRQVIDDAHSSIPVLGHRHGNDRSDTVRHGGEVEQHGLIFARQSGSTLAFGGPEAATFQLFDLNGSLVTEWNGMLDDVAVPSGLTGRFILVVRADKVVDAVKLQIDR